MSAAPQDDVGRTGAPLPEAGARPHLLQAVSAEVAQCRPAARAEARIGPNALIQVAETLRSRIGEGPAMLLFVGAGLGHRFVETPAEMVPEAEAIRLHAHLRSALGAKEAEAVAAEAGRRTADYLLANRIPRPAQRMLKLLPARLSARLLMQAIGGHAWTFAGSGRFAWQPGRPIRFQIADSPLSRDLRAEAPVCAYYAATFQRLFRVLVAPDAYALETGCRATGAETCRFEVRY